MLPSICKTVYGSVNGMAVSSVEEKPDSKIFRAGTVGGGKCGLINHPFDTHPCAERGRERVSAINSLILGLPGDKLTPGAASEAAFVCYWQELLWALVGSGSCWNTGMSQCAPTPVYLATRPESPVEVEKHQPCSPSTYWGGLLCQGYFFKVQHG